MRERCGKCDNCKDFDKQRAAFSAAISEATPTERERRSTSEGELKQMDDKADALRSSWNELKARLPCQNW